MQSAQMAGRITVGVVAVGCDRPSLQARFFLRNADDNVWLTGADFQGRPFAADPEQLLDRDGDLWRPRDPKTIDPSTVGLVPRVTEPTIGALPGCYPAEDDAVWCRKSWKINVVGPPNQDAVVSFVIENSADPDARLTVRDGARIRSVTARPGRVVKQRVRIGPTGGARLNLRYSGRRFPSPGDARQLYVRINSLKVTPAG